MKPSLEFIAFSDIQLDEWKRPLTSEPRMDICFSILRKLDRISQKYQVPLLFCGDFFDNPKYITNRVFSYLPRLSGMFPHGLYGISGNHDQYKSDDFFKTLTKIFPNITNLSGTVLLRHDFSVAGIEYSRGNVGFKESMEKVLTRCVNPKKILLIHTDLYGAVNTQGFEIGEVENIPRALNKFFKPFDLVLSGHIHKPQKITSKIYMLGSVYQQRVSDMGEQMGYWKIYSDCSIKFVPLKYPEFKYLEEGQEKPDDYHIYITVPKKLVRNKGINDVDFDTSVKPKDLARRYLKHKGMDQEKYVNALLSYIHDSL